MAINKRYTQIIILICLLATVFSLFISDLLFGSVDISIKDVFKILLGYSDVKASWHTIIFEFRFPKAITAILVGGALSLSGLQMQTLFRNPLAGPDVLGVSAGAGLGVALLILGFNIIGITSLSVLGISGDWALVIAACVGAGLVLFLIFLTSLYINSISTILILGIMFGSAIGALVNILQYFSNEAMLKTYIIWTMGDLGGVTNSKLHVMAPVIAFGFLTSFLLSKQLNLILLGENYSKSMGLNYKRTQLLVILNTTILTGTATAFCGPIAFIGIAVPHICRFIFKTSDHKFLLPASLLVGSIFMLISDIICQLPGTNQTLPINSITALFGAPIVIWVILRNRKINSYFGM